MSINPEHINQLAAIIREADKLAWAQARAVVRVADLQAWAAELEASNA